MVTLPAAAARALRAVAQLRSRAADVPDEGTRSDSPGAAAPVVALPPAVPDPQLTDDANWLDLDREEQIAFDEKLSLFLDLDVENKERNWLLPNS